MSGEAVKALVTRLDAESSAAASVGNFEASGILHQASEAVKLMWTELATREEAAKTKKGTKGKKSVAIAAPRLPKKKP